MNEIMEMFKVDVEELFEEMCDRLDGILDNAMFEMRSYEGDDDEHYEIIREVMIETLMKKALDLCNITDES